MKIFTILIFLSLSFFLIQEVFAQEYGMIQEGYLHFPVGEKYFHYKTNPPMAMVEEVQNRCWFTATFFSKENNGEATYQFPNDMIWPGAFRNSAFFYFHTKPWILNKRD